MSKQCPSNAAPQALPAKATHRLDGKSVAFWRRRIFKNTYTRNDRQWAVKSWSVKIQHQGQRRTLSLQTTRRDLAAVEAQTMCRTILTQGWDAVLSTRRRSRPELRQVRAVGARADFPTTDARYWKRRLLLRKYPIPFQAVPAGEYSTRIEHAGVHYYFPLRTLDAEAAARNTLEIYRTVVNEGWDAAKQRFRRELTVAFHWAANPVAWTYTTFHTWLSNERRQPVAGANKTKPEIAVAIVEPEVGIRQALAASVHCQVGFRCAGFFAGAVEALRELRSRRFDLILINHILPDRPGRECADQMRTQAPNAASLIYSVYEDSDQLFKATPGGAVGYLLKRTSPRRILEPIAGMAGQGVLSPEQMSNGIRRYFQSMIASLPAGDSVHDLARLTHREQEILSFLSKGFLDKEIADALRISIWTVHGHLKRIFEKLGVHTRTEAAVKYLHK